MIDSLRVSGTQTRDWHNYDYLDRETGLAWPWPAPRRETLWSRMTRLMGWIAGLVASQPPDCQPDQA